MDIEHQTVAAYTMAIFLMFTYDPVSKPIDHKCKLDLICSFQQWVRSVSFRRAVTLRARHNFETKQFCTIVYDFVMFCQSVFAGSASAHKLQLVFR